MIIAERDTVFLCNADTVVEISGPFCDAGSDVAIIGNTLAPPVGLDCFTGDRIYSQIKK